MAKVNESIVYLLRKTSLSLKEIGNLSPRQFNTILSEVRYQESVEHYIGQHNIASLLAAIYNTIPRKRGSKQFKPSDFIGEMPEREAKDTSLEDMAKEKDIRLPSKELKERR